MKISQVSVPETVEHVVGTIFGTVRSVFLLFVVCAINMAALTVFVVNEWKEYKLEQ